MDAHETGVEPRLFQKPEDHRRISDGPLANQCLESSLNVTRNVDSACSRDHPAGGWSQEDLGDQRLEVLRDRHFGQLIFGAGDLGWSPTAALVDLDFAVAEQLPSPHTKWFRSFQGAL